MNELQATRKLVSMILSQDESITISVYDGEEYSVKRSRDIEAICEHASAVDESALLVRKAGEKLGFFELVYGNGAEDLICDCTDNAFCDRIFKVFTGL